MLITLGLGVLFLLTRDQLHVSPGSISDPLLLSLGLGICGLSFAGSVAWTLERRRGGAIFAGLLALLSTINVLLLALFSSAGLLPVVYSILNAMTAAWLIGAAIATMLLGHWYLTATGMPLTPFVQYTYAFLIAIVMRVVTVGGMQWTLASTVDPNWSLSILRWAGLAGPLIMAFLTLRILRYRNTQSATGVLYAATTLVFMGEMAASLLHRTDFMTSSL